MVSRDTRVHLTIFFLVVVAFFVSYGPVPIDSPLATALAVVGYGLILGGAHLYLAIRGDDGLIPVESRWRYVTALTIVFLATLAIVVVGDQDIGPTTVETIGLGLIVVTAIGYLIAEGTSGYRDSRPT